MDRNAIIGMSLIFILVLAWSYFNRPSPEEVATQERIRDSIAQVQAEALVADSIAQIDGLEPSALADTTEQANIDPVAVDSIKTLQMGARFGAFAPSGTGTEEEFVLENDKLKVIFSSKGGKIKYAEFKTYKKDIRIEDFKKEKVPVLLMEDEKNKFSFQIPVTGAVNDAISSTDLYFTGSVKGKTLSFEAQAVGGGTLTQTYTISEEGYGLSHQVALNGLESVVPDNGEGLQLNWTNFLDKIELNVDYERSYSTVYFKPTTDGVDYCSCRSDDEEEIKENIKWVSHSHQFFNTTLIADNYFGPGKMETVMLENEGEDLKKLVSQFQLPLNNGKIDMQWYIGPNEYKLLQAYDLGLEDIVPFGSSILGTVNRWVIRPLFSFLSSFIGSAGLVILALTLIVKLVLYPLTYKMLYSQSKMGALKPEIAKAREKYKDDQQKQSMETMKIYREFGVNPLGGCFPIVLQMPIWIALYRFFPASIEFRQASFLWADDLSSFDEFWHLSFSIPFYGDHVSLFTLLWAITTLIYTYYNSKHMDMNAVNPAMKYMQYFMPIMFLFFFNNFASGLTCYLFFSNSFNIAQTLITKNYIINQDKIKAEMEAYRKKPKKKGGFQERLQKALQEQQRVQADREKQKKGGAKNKKKS